MKKVFIIGANGFLGNTLVKSCARLGWVVDAADIKPVLHSKELINNVLSIDESRHFEYDYIFNVAAFIPYGAYNAANEAMLDSNLGLPLQLHKIFPETKIIYSSSVSVYGETPGILNEQSGILNPQMYGLSKLSGELICAHHKRYAILRFSSLYGTGMNGVTFLPKIIESAKTNKTITLFGNGERMQNYIHVSDAAGFCIHAALYGINEPYLGVFTKSYSNLEVAEIIGRYLPACTIRFSGEDKSPSFMYNNDYSQQKLKFVPKIDLESGIKELINE